MGTEKNKQQNSKKPEIYLAEIDSLKKELIKCSNKTVQLQKTQESLEAIIEETSLAIIIGNKKGQIIDANQKALNLTKYDHEEIRQRNLNEIIINEDIPAIVSTIPQKKSSSKSHEQILIRKNGKKIFVSTRITILPDNNYQVFIKSINKRKKAELAFEELQNRYRRLAENIQDVIWTASKDMKIVYISGSISKITGFPPEIYYQRPLSEFITPISYQLLVDTFKNYTDTEETVAIPAKEKLVDIEIKLLQKQHSSIWVELVGSKVKNQFGETVGFQGVIRNIDNQKKAQEILDKNNQRYNFAIRSFGSGVWELNADLTKISIDENLLTILGYHKKGARAFLNDWISLTYKEDRIQIIDILQDILDGKKFSDSFECRRIHKNGTLIWFQDYVEAVHDADGNIIELLGTSKNISNEKLTEEKKYKYYAGLQKLIESTFQFLKLDSIDQIYNYTGQVLIQSIPDSLIILSKINPEINEIEPFKFFGLNNPVLIKHLESGQDDHSGKPIKLTPKVKNLLAQKILIEFKEGFAEFIQPALPRNIYDELKDSIRNNRLYIIGIERNSTITESIFIILKEKNSELANKEFIEAFISLSSIIFDKKKIEDELKRTNDTKDKFFSIISHDLKNPFNTFIGFSGLIMQNIDKNSKEKIFEFAKMINSAALQSYDMMQNLFDWASSQKGILKCIPVKIDIIELIQSNINLFQSEAIKKNISVEFITGPEIDLYADKDMMNTIFRNLISNALKFTNAGGKIIVSYKQEKRFAHFSVKDNGIGISKDDQKNLFHPNANKSTIGTNQEKGTGLGLLLCYEFVSIHKGKMWVESEENQGTEFLFTIPVKK